MLFLAKSAFGLEGFVSRDLKRLGAERVRPLSTGGVLFEGDMALGFSANLWLRTADRVMLVVGQFSATTFDQLFEETRALPWPDLIPRDGRFPVQAHCARSTLMSPSDCQSIVKKAVVESLKRAYRQDWFDESGALYPIDVALHEDTATICLDMSGTALNRRGYRTWNGEAPLRETLAAALVLASPWHPNQPLCDPCCGTGTLLVEAAFIALDRAPGLNRTFACEQWPLLDQSARDEARAAARERFERAAIRPLTVYGSDIDTDALTLARRHIAQAGLQSRVFVEQRDLRRLTPREENGVFLCNPPYGERLGDAKQVAEIERALIELMDRAPGWQLCAISADMGFERNARRRADKKRSFYNGRLECDFLTFAPLRRHDSKTR